MGQMRRGAKRQREFDYTARPREKPALGTGAYGRLWGIVDGGVRDALKAHPDYLTPKGQHSARTSIVKRVTGTVIGFAEQSARGRGDPAETVARASTREPQVSALLEVDAEAGASTPASPHPHCRITRVRFKRRSRYRSPQAFDIKTNELLAAVGYAHTLSILAGRAIESAGRR